MRVLIAIFFCLFRAHANDSDYEGGSLLPEHLLPESLEGSAAPVFLEEPKDAFVIRNRPARLYCKAAHALKVYFQCSGSWGKDKHEESGLVDPMTGIRQTESHLDVPRNALDQYFGKEPFSCRCTAWSSTGEVVSRKATITDAYLRKYFLQDPYSTNVELNGQVELKCRAPEGVPPPEVKWLRNGAQIDFDANSDPNLILSSEGNLIIAQARLQDMANYTCVASNIAATRYSQNATLTVYAVDGGWSSWSAWSTCGPNCLSHRRRTCTNPRPQNGGAYCVGKDDITDNCTGGMCRAGMDNSIRMTEDAHSNSHVLAMLICMVIGFVVVIVVVAVLCYFKKRNHPMYAVAAGSDCPQAIYRDREKKLISFQPDLTRNVNATSCFEYEYSDPSGGSLKSNTVHNGGLAAQEHHYESPQGMSSAMGLLGGASPLPPQLPPPPSPPSHATASLGSKKVPPSESDRSLDSLPSSTASCKSSTVGYGCEGMVPLSSVATSPMSPVGSHAVAKLPPRADASNLVLGRVTPAGGRLALPNCGISLTVPEDAVADTGGPAPELFLMVQRDDRDRPPLSDGQTLLSPVIICGGAPNLVLKKPVILSFQHCASLQHGHWTLAVYNSGDDVVLPGQSCTWDRVVQLGDETIITPVFTQLDSTHCHLMIETLGRYALIGRSANAGGYAVKSLQVAAFVSPMSVPSVDADLRLRIYCMEDNRSSLQGVLAVERKLQGQLVDQPKTLLFQDGGGGLLLKVDPGQHYRVSPPQRQEIQFPLVWSSPQTALLMSVSLEKIDPCAPDIVIGHILMSQLHPVPVASLPLPLPRSQTLLLELDLQQTSMIYPQPGLAANFNASAGKLSLEPCDKVFRISGIVKKHLCQSLDPPNLQGNDWRLLAQHLGMDRYINYFATKSSPTEAILDLWEARNRDVNAVPEIVAILLSMNRRDAAVSLQQIPSATVQPMVW